MTERVTHFANDIEKAGFLDAEASLDARHPALEALARSIVGPWRDYRTAADLLFRWVRDRIAYRPDRPWALRDASGITRHGVEEFADSMTIVRRQYDDCDGKERLFVALVRSLDMPDFKAAIRPVFIGGQFKHVQAAVNFPGSRACDFRHVDADGWVPAEVILKRAALGELPEDVPREADGSWKT